MAKCFQNFVTKVRKLLHFMLFLRTRNFKQLNLFNSKNPKVKMKKVIYLRNTKANRTLAEKHNAKKKVGYYIILLALPLPIHRVIAVLEMPAGNADRGVRAKDISVAAAVSTYVAVPPATITALNLLIANYNGATPATRTNLYRLLLNGLNSLMRTFQTAADADSANAIAIIESGAFRVKNVAIRQKQEFEVSNGLMSGEVDLIAAGGKSHTCHDWMYSADGTIFTRMAPTVNAETHKTGLTPGTYAYFTHELVTKDGGQGVSQIVKIIVK